MSFYPDLLRDQDDFLNKTDLSANKKYVATVKGKKDNTTYDSKVTLDGPSGGALTT